MRMIGRRLRLAAPGDLALLRLMRVLVHALTNDRYGRQKLPTYRRR